MILTWRLPAADKGPGSWTESSWRLRGLPFCPLRRPGSCSLTSLLPAAELGLCSGTGTGLWSLHRLLCLRVLEPHHGRPLGLLDPPGRDLPCLSL